MKKELEKIKNVLGDGCEYIVLAYVEEKSNNNLTDDYETSLDAYYLYIYKWCLSEV